MREVTIKETISTIDRLLEATRLKCDETTLNRHLALYDLTHKMRACIDAVIAVEKYDILCVPTNILYRCLITDLLTSLLITVIDENQFKEVMHIMNFKCAQSLRKSIKVGTDVRKEIYPNDAIEFEKQSLAQQELYYDYFKDCLNSVKGEEWSFIKKPQIEIQGEKFNGQVDTIYKVLLKYPEVKHIASVYEYYKLFSQSEHYSLRSRALIYKQDFHNIWYNKTRGYICLGEQYIYDKYKTTYLL